ncbi:VTT domain-containing protein [Candidatus Peregrinibacteria bacterium]|nr:VTT domain-containing protein [Candidatus Peregrinibacteria bacterium]
MILSIFTNIIVSLSSFKYLVIFFGAFFEGPVVMVATGFLLRLGYFPSVILVLLILVSGDLLADAMWYSIGYLGLSRIFHKFGVSRPILQKTKELFRKHEDLILLISKVTMGFGFAIPLLVTAGIMHVPFRKVLLYNLIGGLLWTSTLLAIGYFFGNVYSLIDEKFQIIFVAGSFMIFLATLYSGIRYIRKLTLNNN